jgi:hypothetical protein
VEEYRVQDCCVAGSAGGGGRRVRDSMRDEYEYIE